MKILLTTFLLASIALFAGPGDTTHVITHNQVLMTTNPGTGSNGVKAWGIFPSPTTPVRKAYVMMNYKCPGGMSCGAWDYIDQIIIRRAGGVNSPALNREIVRFITPYGNTFSSSWKFGFHMDITDYADMLRDSIEVEYIHTGYEGTNVGWSVTLDFNIIEGTPLANQTSFQQLWEGSFQYGNATSDIDLNLQPISFNTDANCS